MDKVQRTLSRSSSSSDVRALRKRRKGQVYVWGCNEISQLGLGAVITNVFRPEVMDMKKKKAVFISAGAHHNALITSSGELYTWGLGKDGQLGLGNTTTGYIAQRVPSLRKRVTFVSCGDRYTTALVAEKSGGQLYTWGKGALGYACDGPTCDPAVVSAFKGKNVICSGGGGSHTACIVQNPGGDTEVYTWGTGGRSLEVEDVEPHLIEPLRAVRSREVFCGHDYSAVLTERNDLYTWGSGDSGRLGIGSPQTTFIPMCVPLLSQKRVLQVSLGSDHAGAITDSGKLYTWGYGSNGRLGHGEEVDLLEPTLVEGLTTEVITQVSCGGHHTAAVTADGMLFMFGWNHYGQLGIGDPSKGHVEENVLLPVRVAALEEFEVLQISCGQQHTIALVATPTS